MSFSMIMMYIQIHFMIKILIIIYLQKYQLFSDSLKEQSDIEKSLQDIETRKKLKENKKVN